MEFPDSGRPQAPHRTSTVPRKRKTKKKSSRVLPRMPDLVMGRYAVDKQVGKGAFGAVYRAVDTMGGSVVAVKAVSTRAMNDQQKEDIQGEVQLMKELPPNEYIVRYIGSEMAPPFLFIVMEFIDNTSLKVHFKNNLATVTGERKERLCALFVCQILLGLQFLHEECVIHRDIKAANVLVTNSGVAKLTDFGVARKQQGESGDGGELEVAGTPYWMAPEIIEMQPPTTSCDIWSVGATAIELFTGAPPYFHMSPMSAMFRIVQDPKPPVPTGISPHFDNFLNRCFVREPSMRESAKKLIVSCLWFKVMLTDEVRYQDAARKFGATAKSTRVGAAVRSLSPRAVADDSKWDSSGESGGEDEMGGFKDGSIKAISKYREMQVERKKRRSEKFGTGKLLESKEASGEDEDESEYETEDSSDDWDASDDSGDAVAKKSASKKVATLTTPSMLKKTLLSKIVTDDVLDIEGGREDESSVSDDDFDFGDGPLDLKANMQMFAAETAAAAEKDDLRQEEWLENDDDEDIANQALNATAIQQTLRAIDELISDTDGMDTAPMTDASRSMAVSRLRSYLDTISAEYDRDKERCLSQLINLSVVSIIELLQVKDVEVLDIVLSPVLRLINDPVHGNQLLEHLCLVQLIPVVGAMINDRDNAICIRGGKLLRQLCDPSTSSLFSRKMFVASGGVKYLTDAIKKKYTEINKPIIFCGIDCAQMLFFGSRIGKKDLARLYVKEDVVAKAMFKFKDTVDDVDDADLEKIVKYSNDLALFFSKICKFGDRVVKKMLAEGIGAKGVLTILLATFPALMTGLRDEWSAGRAHGNRQTAVQHILEGLEELSRNAIGIDALMKHKLVAKVCQFLDIPSRNRQIMQLISMILYNMTRITGKAARSALQEAAKNQALGHLIRLHRESAESALGHVLVEVLTRFARNPTEASLLELRKHNMAELYLQMALDYTIATRMHSITALSAWISEPTQTERLEMVLTTPDNVTTLIRLFAAPVANKLKTLCKMESLRAGQWAPKARQLLESYTTIFRSSKLLAEKFGKSDLFLSALSAWLKSSLDASLSSESSEDLLQFTKTLLEMTRSFLAKLGRDEAKKFHQVMLPTIDEILKMNIDKRVIKGQIERKLLKAVAVTIESESDALHNVSEHTRNIILDYQRRA